MRTLLVFARAGDPFFGREIEQMLTPRDVEALTDVLPRRRAQGKQRNTNGWKPGADSLVAAVMMIGRGGFGKFSGFVSYPGEAELSHRSSRMKRGDRIRRTRLWQYK
jgi:hypothetical protein